jgi:hypothetical protein
MTRTHRGQKGSKDRPAVSLFLPRSLASIRSRVRGTHSLREVTRRALPPPPRHIKRRSRAAIGLLEGLAHPGFAIGAVIFVGALMSPPIADVSLFDGCAIPTVLCNQNLVRPFLATFWQVLGGSLALTVAAALFAFENATQARTQAGLREFVERSHMLPYIMTSVAALGAIGVVLLAGESRPPLTASATATGLGGLTLLILPIFIRRAIRVIDAEWFHRQVLADIERAASEHVYNEARTRVADALLSDSIASVEDQQAMAFLPGSLDVMETTAIDGEVFDIDLARLADLAGQPTTVLGRIGSYAPTGRALLGTPSRQRGNKPIYTVVSSRRERPIDRAVELLHDEAMAAIEAAEPASYGDICALYVELLSAWPRLWQSLGVLGDAPMLNDARFTFGLTPTDKITRGLNEQMLRAHRLELREHVYAIVVIPWRVLRTVEELRPRQLLSRLASTAREFARLATPDAAFTELISSRVSGYHLDLAESALRRLKDGARGEDGKAWCDIATDAVQGAAHLMRGYVEIGNLDAFEELHRSLGQLGDYSELESLRHEATSLLQYGGGGDHEIDDARQSLAVIEHWDEVLANRDAASLALLSWLLMDDDRRGAFNSVQLVLVAQLRNVDRLLKAAPHVLSYDGVMDEWIGRSLPAGEVHSIDPMTPALHGIAFVLLSASPDPTVAPAEWLPHHRDGLLRALRDAGLQARVATHCETPVAEVSARAGRLAHGVARAAEQRVRQTENDLMDAELDPKKVSGFKALVEAGYEQARELDEFAAAAGFLIEARGAHEPTWGLMDLDPKESFVASPAITVVGRSGEQFGSRLASDEIASVIRLVAREAVPVVGSPPALWDCVRQLTDMMVNAGWQPSMVLLPRNWRLLKALGLPHFTDGAIGTWSRGDLDGVPVFVSNAVPAHRVIMADMPHAVAVREDPGLTIEALRIDEARATELAAQWQPVPDAESVQRLRTLQQRVEVKALRSFEVSTRDRLAMRSVWLPPGARA